MLTIRGGRDAEMSGGHHKPDVGVEMLNLYSKVPEMQWVSVSVSSLEQPLG